MKLSCTKTEQDEPWTHKQEINESETNKQTNNKKPLSGGFGSNTQAFL